VYPLIAAAAIVGLLLPGVALAQYPTDMSFCVAAGQLEACLDVVGNLFLDFACPTWAWQSYYGRVAWNPLRYVGPITIEVEARRTTETRFPIYIEYVPLKDRSPDLGFCDGPGNVLMVVWGGTACDSKETSGPFPLRLEIGDSYFLRGFWFDSSTGEASYMRCIRVTANPPSPATVLGPRTWGLVKSLYR
jgi:hypothetical protein